MTFAVTAHVSLRPGIADPEGATIERSLPALGFDSVHQVRVGKSISFQMDADDEDQARRIAAEMCDRFLTNPVIEDATVSVETA